MAQSARVGRLVIGSAGAATVALAIASWWPHAEPRAPLVELRQVVAFLADDAMQGRALGSPGEASAAAFITSTFTRLNFAPSAQPFTVAVEGATLRSPGNVVARLDVGAKHTVVLGAHYEHIGLGERYSREPLSKAVHNGADDNASGVAVLLRLADDFARAPKPPAVNLVFVAFSGEEEGLHGSQFFLRSGLVPERELLCFINFDMVGRLDPQSSLLTIEGPMEFSEWSPLLDALPRHGLTLRTSEPIARGSSDHDTFAQAGYPVLSISTGMTQEYHRPSDDLATLNFEGMQRVVDFSTDLIDAIAAHQSEFTRRRVDAGPAR